MHFAVRLLLILLKLKQMTKHYNHGIFYPITGVAPIPLQLTQTLFTEGAKTNYELWQMRKYGNFIKAQGTEFIERFIDNKNK
jgi:hypothetical protein